MKTYGILLAGALLLGFSSCERDWVCGCTNQDGDYTAHEIKNERLVNARSECRAKSYDSEILGVHTSQDCDLD